MNDQLINFSDIIFSLLSGSTGVTSYVGDRIYPIDIPDTISEDDKIRPCIVFEYEGENNYTKNEYFCADLPVDIYIYTEDLQELKNIAKEINQTLHDFEGQILDSFINSSLFMHYAETQTTGNNLNGYLAKMSFEINIS